MWPVVHKWWLLSLVFPGDGRGWESADGRGEGGQDGEAEESGETGPEEGDAECMELYVPKLDVR